MLTLQRVRIIRTLDILIIALEFPNALFPSVTSLFIPRPLSSLFSCFMTFVTDFFAISNFPHSKNGADKELGRAKVDVCLLGW